MSASAYRVRALVQACKKKDYDGELFVKENYTLGRQIESEFSFEGNWWYVWLKKGKPTDIIKIGDTIVTDRQYTVKDIHFYKNYKRGSVLLSF